MQDSSWQFLFSGLSTVCNMLLHVIGTPAFVACDVLDYLPRILVVTGFAFSLVLLYASLSPDQKVFDKALLMYNVTDNVYSSRLILVFLGCLHISTCACLCTQNNPVEVTFIRPHFNRFFF